MSTNAYAVVSAPSNMSALAFAFFPRGGSEMTGAGRVYRIFSAPDRITNLMFADPTDGETLIDIHAFDSLEAAKQFIANDIALRTVATRAQ